MNWAAPILEYGGILLAGGSAFLAVGLLINLLQRAPILRIRIAEMAVGCALIFGVLTLAPLPRAFAPAPIELAQERPPVPKFDLAPFLHLINEASAGPVEDGLALDIDRFVDPAAAHPELVDSLQSPVATLPAPLVDAPPPSTELGAVETGSIMPLGKIVLGIWLAGAALAITWLLLGAHRIRRLLRSSRPAPRPLLRLLREQGVQIPRLVRLRLSDREVRPFCVGALRPTIVIPSSLLDESQSDSLAPVVQHELAHATQGDARGLWLFAIALVPLWFHPLFWWLRAQHRFATELVADAIAADKTSNRAYARELMHLVERQAEQPTLVVGATALFRKRSDFYQRMQMLLTRNNTLATRTSVRRRALHGFLALGLLTGATSVGGVTPASAQEPAADPAVLIQQLQAENAILRAELQEMRVVLTDLKDMLAHMQMQRESDRRAESHDRLRAQMDRTDAHGRKVDSVMREFDPRSPEQVQALAELGYVIIDDSANYLSYTVKAGDSLAKIAKSSGLSLTEGLQSIAKLNPDLFQIDAQGRISGNLQLQPGMTVRIPSPHAQAPRDGQLRGSITTNSPSGFHSGLIQSGRGSSDAKGNPRTVDTQGAPILADIPLVGDLFPAQEQAASNAAAGSAPADSSTTAQMHSSLPPVNLAECMELSFRAIDLQGELELAKAAYEHSQQLAKQGRLGGLENRRAQIALTTLERKYSLSRSVLEARMHDFKQQINELGAHYTKDHPQFPHREISLREQALAILAESF